MKIRWIIDTIIISGTARLPPPLLKWLWPMLSPLVVWRVEGITRDIIEACRKLPAIPWDEVEKHGGHHVLCLSKKKVDVFSKETRFVGAWVVDKKHSTLRIVFNLPEEYRKMGATF